MISLSKVRAGVQDLEMAHFNYKFIVLICGYLTGPVSTTRSCSERLDIVEGL